MHVGPRSSPDAGSPYWPPTLKIVDATGTDFCAGLNVFYAVAGYCSTNNALTISSGFVDPDAVNIVLTLLSHESGHHVQNLTNTGITSAFGLRRNYGGRPHVSSAGASVWCFRALPG